MPGYRRYRYVNRPAYYTNSTNFKAPAYIADIPIYFYKVSEVVVAIAPAPFAADLKQWYLNDTGTAINYTNNTGGSINVFLFTSDNNFLFMDRIGAGQTKSIPNAAHFVMYSSTSAWMPIIDSTGTTIFSIYEGVLEAHNNNVATVFNGSYFLALQYKVFVPSTRDQEARSHVLTGFEFQDIFEEDEDEDHIDNTQTDEPPSKKI